MYPSSLLFEARPLAANALSEPLLSVTVQNTGGDRMAVFAISGAAVPEPSAAALCGAGLLALVRRESGFRPEARSLAGALGLGQLLPRTAARLGVLAGLDADPAERLAERLAEPATNLALAALYLGLLRDRFGSDVVALAAYNAGPAAPAGWGRAATPLDEWVENVPYKETRNYLKLVLAAREVYRRRQGLPPLLDPAALVSVAGEGVAF